MTMPKSYARNTALGIATLIERIKRANKRLNGRRKQAKQQKMQTSVSFGATILSSFVGKKAISASLPEAGPQRLPRYH